MDWEKKHWTDEDKLHVEEFNRVDCSNRKGGRLLISVVKFVEMFVEKRVVVQAMVQISQVILIEKEAKNIKGIHSIIHRYSHHLIRYKTLCILELY